ncbi:hypothetical protein AX15_007499, partial [Amanita polypyramis BW_CC]
PEECQALVGKMLIFIYFLILIIKAMVIIAKQSFWIKKDIGDSLMDAFDQFKRQGHIGKLKAQITSMTLPSNHEELLKFLYEYAIQI